MRRSDKIHANANHYSALSCGHAEWLDAQLKGEVRRLLPMAEKADGVDVP